MQSAATLVDRCRTELAIYVSIPADTVDALAFITLGGLFVSFMTGNTTWLGVGLANSDLHEGSISAAIIFELH